MNYLFFWIRSGVGLAKNSLLVHQTLLLPPKFLIFFFFFFLVVLFFCNRTRASNKLSTRLRGTLCCGIIWHLNRFSDRIYMVNSYDSSIPSTTCVLQYKCNTIVIPWIYIYLVWWHSSRRSSLSTWSLWFARALMCKDTECANNGTGIQHANCWSPHHHRSARSNVICRKSQWVYPSCDNASILPIVVARNPNYRLCLTL